jgi:hypothetical protein
MFFGHNSDFDAKIKKTNQSSITKNMNERKLKIFFTFFFAKINRKSKKYKFVDTKC